MKVIGWIVGIVILVVVGAGVYIVLNSGSLIKTAVETLGPSYLGVPVSLGSAELSLTEGTGTLNNLEIGNPAGFDGPDSLRISRVHLALDPSQLSDTLVVIKALEVDGAEVAVIAKRTATNLQAMMDNLAPSGGAEPAADDSGSEMKMIIDKFSFTNAKTTLISDVIGSREVALPDIQLSGIGRKSSGVTAREAVRQLLQPIVRGTTEAVAREGLNVDELKQNATEKVQESIGKGLKGLTDRLNQN